MKRIRNLLTLIIMITSLVMLSGCYSNPQAKPKVMRDGFILCESYGLVSVNPEIQNYEKANFSGSFLICFGGISGEYEKRSIKVYQYWYQRSDGGILEGTIDKTKYLNPESIRIVVYENDNVSPKLEIWKNPRGEGSVFSKGITEYRFTIPKGTFRNYYNFQNVNDVPKKQ